MACGTVIPLEDITLIKSPSVTYPITVSIVGRSGVGKTRFIESLIPILSREGVSFGLIKHTHHQIDIDPAGKDSYRFSHAGAPKVVIAGSEELVFVQRRGTDSGGKFSPSNTEAAQSVKSSRAFRLEQLISQFFSEEELVLVEGFRSQGELLYEVLRRGFAEELMVEKERLSGIIADFDPGLGLPLFPSAEADAFAEEIFAMLQGIRAYG